MTLQWTLVITMYITTAQGAETDMEDRARFRSEPECQAAMDDAIKARVGQERVGGAYVKTAYARCDRVKEEGGEKVAEK